jgi:hypothetical protein
MTDNVETARVLIGAALRTRATIGGFARSAEVAEGLGHFSLRGIPTSLRGE